MAKKGKKTGVYDLVFGEIDPYGAVIGQPISKPIERFPLEAIRPDPEQPRRLMPSDLTEAFNQEKTEPSDVIKEWQRLADANSNSRAAHEMRELERLAAAIEQHGLINPITIRPADDERGQYIIVTGERRYWAHVLLDHEERPIQEGDTQYKPDQIKATLVPAGAYIRAHQIVENLMREDINVVEKAHGLWALRREMSTDAYRRHAESAKDEEPKLVPWSQVEKSLDISRQYRLRIISVLKLSEEAQQLVNQHNLAEATIRPIVEKLQPYPDLQLAALQQLINWQKEEAGGEGEGRRIVPSVRALVDKLLSSREAKTIPPQVQSLDFGKFRQKVRGALHYMQKLDETAMTEFARILDNEAGADIVDELEALRDQIDEMLMALSDEGEDTK